MDHKIYRSIVEAVREKRLKEPFTSGNVRRDCPEINPRTPGTFLPKHAKGNPGGNSELFDKVGRGSYRLLHPVKYSL